jgi:hypothetical protein
MPLQVRRQHMARHEPPQRLLHRLYFLRELEVHDRFSYAGSTPMTI